MHFEYWYATEFEGALFENFKLVRDNGIPVWIQIRDYLKFQIESGQARPGEVLPTVRSLAVQLKVNYNTIHKVYQALEAEGLIDAGQGKRSTIRKGQAIPERTPRPPSLEPLLKPLIAAAQRYGITKDQLIKMVDESYPDKRGERSEHFKTNAE